MSSATCSECGARIDQDLQNCELCGWKIESEGEDSIDAQSIVSAPESLEGIFCNACGWKNPPSSRFCSKCGEKLQEIVTKQTLQEEPDPGVLSTKAASLEESTPSKPVSKGPAPLVQVVMILGIAVCLVGVVFLISTVSKRVFPKEVEQQVATTTLNTDPLSPALAEQLADLDDRIASETGEARMIMRREKAFLLMQSDRTDLAALEYQAIAESSGRAEDWNLAGDLFYNWMDSEEDPNQKALIASNVIASYEEVLALQPDNLGVRTDLATAYLSTGSPMLGVTEIKRVLEEDSTHLHANFNYGLMLWQIGRVEQASEQFNKILDFAEPGSEFYTRASEALELLEQAPSF